MRKVQIWNRDLDIFFQHSNAAFVGKHSSITSTLGSSKIAFTSASFDQIYASILVFDVHLQQMTHGKYFSSSTSNKIVLSANAEFLTEKKVLMTIVSEYVSHFELLSFPELTVLQRHYIVLVHTMVT